MKTPAALQPLIDDGVIDEVIRSLKSGKQATVYLVRSVGRSLPTHSLDHVSSRRPCRSGEVNRKTFEIDDGAAPDGTFVSCAQNHARRLPGLQRFLPTRRAQAPPIARLQACKAEFRSGCRKIIATGFGELQKRRSHHDSDSMTSNVLSAGVTAAIPKEPRHWV